MRLNMLWFRFYLLLALILPMVQTSALYAQAESNLGSATEVTEPRLALRRLLEVMKQRLEVMEQVAAYKWNAKEPIEDLAREKQVIDAFISGAANYNLDKEYLTAFIQAQMNAAKELQRKLFVKWKAMGLDGFDETPNLVKDIRPKLDKMKDAMLGELVKIQEFAKQSSIADFVRDEAKSKLQTSMIDEEVVNIAIAPLLVAKQAASPPIEVCDVGNALGS